MLERKSNNRLANIFNEMRLKNCFNVILNLNNNNNNNSNNNNNNNK